MSLRISVLTPRHSRYGVKLLNQLSWNGVPVEQVVLFTDLGGSRRRWLLRAARRVGWLNVAAYVLWQLRSPFRRQGDFWRGRQLQLDYSRLAKRVDCVPSPRSSLAVAALEVGQPQLCLLAGCDIVPAALLAVPSMATLNAHPGMLPHYRGLDSLNWAIDEGRFDLVGCTLHLADRGIDTGDILEARPYVWRGDETLARLAWRLNETCLDLLAGACSGSWPDYRERATPQGEGRYYHLMPAWRRLTVGQKLRRAGRIGGLPRLGGSHGSP